MTEATLVAALASGRLSYVRGPWPWRAAAWCAQAAVASWPPIGLAAAVVAPPLSGAWDLRTVGGLALEALMLALFVTACAATAAWQRRAVRILHRPAVVSAYPVPLGPAAGPARRLGHRLRGWTRDAALGRDVLFSVAFAPLGALATVLVVLLPFAFVGVCIGVVAALRGQAVDGGAPWSFWAVAGATLLLAIAAPWLWGLIATGGAALARGVMDPGDDRARAQAAALAASRRRLTDAFDAERRRIERDLHDGAQQAIVAQSMTLGLAASELAALGPEGAEAARLVDQARSENRRILADLRDLVRRVHPQVLAERGLAAALDEVVARSLLATTCRVRLPDRPDPLIESTAYFVVLEALTNAAKHSVARHADVRVVGGRDDIAVLVADDGVGGAGLEPGGGLMGLADRVEAVGGSFAISSPRGHGTIVRADLPRQARPASDSIGAGSPAQGAHGGGGTT